MTQLSRAGIIVSDMVPGRKNGIGFIAFQPAQKLQYGYVLTQYTWQKTHFPHSGTKEIALEKLDGRF